MTTLLKPPEGWTPPTWEEFVAQEETDPVRHLSGKHDQKSHGRKSGVSGAAAYVAEGVSDIYGGGATLDPLDGFAAPSTGICVARRASDKCADGVENAKIVDADAFFSDPAVLVSFVDERHDTFLTDKGAGEFGKPEVGVWHNVDEGKVYLDVTDVVPSSQKDAALALGRDQNQISVFDLDNMEEIATGGTGRGRQAEPGSHRVAAEGLGQEDPGAEAPVGSGSHRPDEAEGLRHLAGKHDQKSHAGGGGGSVDLQVREYEGEVGNRDHITRVETGSVSTSAIADLPGARGERPGEHRNREGEEWDSFVSDVKSNGVKEPIFVTVDPGVGARISEGNHRRDAAVEAGLPRVPVEIRYFGHAERDTLVRSAVRHLAGKHDQKSHAGGRISAGIDKHTKNKQPVPNSPDGPNGADWNSLSDSAKARAAKAWADKGLPVDENGMPDIGAMRDNLVEAYGTASDADIAYGEDFYSQAHNDARLIAETAGVSEAVGAATISTMSPHTEWEANVTWAHFVAEKVGSDPVVDWDTPSVVDSKTATIGQRVVWEGVDVTRTGARLSEFPIDQQSQILKAWGQQPMMAVATGGSKAGRDINVNPMMAGNIEKGIRVLRSDGSREAISAELGGHKTRSFYNNILTSAKVGSDVTIDTHAFDAAILGSGARAGTGHVPDSQKVVISSGSSVRDGVSGWGYAPTVQAYIESTNVINAQREAVGNTRTLSPAEMQAIVWMTTLD